jgi:hypothetical protein
MQVATVHGEAGRRLMQAASAVPGENKTAETCA